MIDYIRATPIIDNATMRPIHDLVMHTEASLMAKLSYVITRLGCPPRSIRCVKTDALILCIPARKLAAVKAAATIRFDQLHTLRRTYEQVQPTQAFLNSHAEITPISSSDPVFRFNDVGHPLLGKYAKPSRIVTPPTPVCSWRDLGEEEARTVVMAGGL